MVENLSVLRGDVFKLCKIIIFSAITTAKGLG